MTREELIELEALCKWSQHYNADDAHVIEVEAVERCNKHNVAPIYAGFRKMGLHRMVYRAFAFCPIMGCNFYFEF